MRSEAYITVTCDHCNYSENVELTSLAGGGWDERDVDSRLREGGWVKDGDQDLCETCKPEEGKEE